jgi:hypothetical protein
VKNEPKSGLVANSIATALSLSLLAGNAAAGASCASPKEATALQIAALRQQLMVAALACHQADSFNRLVISHQGELQESDRTLMRFFVLRDGRHGDDAYNAYKTRLANDSSLRSLHDPQFCGSANVAFDSAFDRNLSLAELVSEQRVETGIESCASSEPVQAAISPPGMPAPHADMLGDTPGANREAYNAPVVNAPNAPPAALTVQQVQGPDGRWYLQPPADH